MARVIEQAGVSVAPTGSTGVQVNEFEAAIKSVTSSTTVGAVFLYDCRNDSDGGAWRKKARGSWYYETLNTATRGGRREFPSVALIVADNDGSGNTVTIYDLDDPAMPMWMVFNAHTPAWETNATFISTNTLTSVYALNGRMYVGGAYGLVEIDFISEQQTNYRPISSTQRVRHKKSGAIVDRNDTSGQFRITATPIVANGVNDVAATYLEGGELDSLGLVRPVAALATDSGVSVIHPNGSVYDIGSIALNKVWFTAENKIGMSRSTTLSDLTVGPIPFADIAWSSYRSQPDVLYAYDGAAADFATVGTGVNAAVDGAIGQSNGLTLWRENLGNPEESLFAYITSTYNTGYMLGDIRFAGLTDVANADRSVKGNLLTVYNASASDYVEKTAVATNAELKAYSNFSADNYMSRAYDADFDFGTGDFSIMFWCKLADTVNATETVLERAYGGNALFNIDFASGVPRLIAYNGSAFDTTTGTRDLSDNQWHQLMCFRKSGVAYIYIDGKQHVSNAMTYDLDNSQAILHIGQTTGNGNPLANGSLSLLRISATAPTPQQIKDIYEAEAPLFRAGAKCLLSQVTHTAVNDLAYDNSSDLLYVGTTSADAGDSVSVYRGLERVDTKDGQDLGWDGASAHYLAAAGGVVGYARNGSETGSGLIIDLPAIDVRGDINTADSKLPDDGKLHFSGVTTDATVTTIGQVPVAENETYMVRAVISGNQYQDQDGERILVTAERTFYRDIGGNILGRSDTMKLTDETTASLDAILSYNTSPPAHNILIKVTGKAGTRMQWNAEVEVQRISEKTYER